GPGTLTNAASHTLTLYYSTIAAPLINQGTLLSRYYSYITGPLTTAAASTIRVEGDYNCCGGYLYVNNGVGFTNNGTILLTAVNGTGSYAYLGVATTGIGTLTNAPGGVIISDPGTGGTRGLDAELINQGTVTVNQPLTMARSNSVHSNSGTINIL